MTLLQGNKLILGLGNPILSDDAIGFVVAEKIKKLVNIPTIDIQTASLSGFRIVDILSKYDNVVIVDSVIGENPGNFYQLPFEDLQKSYNLSSPHSLNLFTAYKICSSYGIKMPKRIIIYVMEAKKMDEFSEILSKEINDKIDEFVEYIIKEEIGGNDVYIT